MVKHIQTVCRALPKNRLNVFDNFKELALKGLIALVLMKQTIFQSIFELQSCLDKKRKYYKDNN